MFVDQDTGRPGSLIEAQQPVHWATLQDAEGTFDMSNTHWTRDCSFPSPDQQCQLSQSHGDGPWMMDGCAALTISIVAGSIGVSA